MKLKKLMSVITAAAMTLSAASSVLCIGTAAYEYYESGTFADKINAGTYDLTNMITGFDINYANSTSQTIIEGPALYALKNALNRVNKEYVRFEIDDGASVTGVPLKYTATLDSSFFAGLSAAPGANDIEADGNGINLALSFVLDTANKTIRINGLRNKAGQGLYNKTVAYTVEYNYAMSLLGNAGISSAKKLRYYYINSAGEEITVNITNASTDQHFYMDSKTFGGLYIEAYDPEKENYYKTEESDPVITQALADAFGMSSTDSLTDIADGIKTLIEGAYLSEADINNYIRKYLFEDSAAGKAHRAQLADLLLLENRDVVVEALYREFGDGTTTYQENAIMNHIWDDLHDKISDEIEDRLVAIVSDPDKYDTTYLYYVAKELFDYNIKQWAEDNFRTLRVLIDDLKANYPNMSLTEILEKLKIADTDTVAQMIREALEQALGYNSVQYTNSSIRERIESAITDAIAEINAKLTAYPTRVEMIAAIPAAVADYFARNAEKFKGDTGKSAYELAVENGFGGTQAQWLESLSGANGKSAYEIAKEYGYTGTEEQWLQSLIGAPGQDGKDGKDGRDGRDGIDGIDGQDGKDGKDGKDGQDGENFYEWAIRTYGSLDGFIAAVANEVLRHVQDGESAYDIAVRNGFRGSEQEWLNSLVGDSAYEVALRNGFTGSEAEWIESLQGADGRDGEDGKDGKDGKDGRDGQIIYMDGYSHNSVGNPDAGDPDDSDDEDEIIVINDSEYVPNKNSAVAGQTNNANARSANPATGAAAGIIIPAAAVGAVLLLKKDKRKRGRRK